MLNGGSSGGAVDAGNPDGSLLYKLVAHQEEPFMPHKKDKLADAQVALVAKWITGGLLETKSSTAKKKKKPAFDLGFVAVTDGKPKGPLPMPEHLLRNGQLTLSAKCQPSSSFSPTSRGCSMAL